MTTDGFIEAVNALDNRDEIDAVVSSTGSIFLRKCKYVVAVFGKNGNEWCFTTNCSNVTIPNKILKLMTEFAENNELLKSRYVILNGNPFLFEGELAIRVFLFSANSLSSSIVSVDDLANFAYTKEKLEQLKAALPKKLQDAVDMLTVTVSEAKKVLKHDHMEQN